MKILMISSYLPFPLLSGGQVRLYNLLKELAKNNKITLICEKRENQTDSDIKEIEKVCEKVITVERHKQWSMQNILKTAFFLHSFLITGHTNKMMRQKIKEELDKNKFDLIHIETFYVAQNLPDTSIPVVLAEHNIEYLVYTRFSEKASFILRPFLYIDIHKIKIEEENFWKKADSLVCVSEEDQKIMQQSGVSASIIPNGVNTDQFTYKNIQKTISNKDKKILFIGDFKWIQNRDALTWIIREIWPKIKNESRITNHESRIKLWIVGRKIPDSIKNLTNDPDILFDQESSSKPTEQIFKEAYILLAPIRVGGGTSYKILESLSCGTPVVITPLSAKSLGLSDSREALIGQTAKELADKTVRLLEDNTLYEKISKNGRSLIEKKYTWKKIAQKLEEVYKNA